MVSHRFNALLGQPQAIELLLAAVVRDRIAPAYLFVGTPGVGRRLAAQCFAELLLSADGNASPAIAQRIAHGNHPDLLWVQPTYLHQGKLLTSGEMEAQGLKRSTPPQVRLEQVRNIGRFLSRPPLEARRSVVLVDAAETMGDAAANALLKTLEEPGQATLILIAPTVESLLPTLVSRCHRIPFWRLDREAIATVLRQQGQDEILQHPEVMALAQGSPGMAIAHWQRLQTISPDVLDSLCQPPLNLRQALELARNLTQALDLETQLWLVDYLQHHYWQRHQPQVLPILETTRRHLLRHVQARLVWEVTWMEICELEQLAISN